MLDIWFFLSLLGAIATMPPYFLSVEHQKLQAKFGKEKGIKIGEVYGLISGWGFFICWIGIWISPQPRFTIPFFLDLFGMVSVANFAIPLVHFMIAMPILISGAWLAIKGVKETTLKAAETHRTETIVTTGVYSFVRHPQYLGGLIAHVGISCLLSARSSLLSTPLLIMLVFLISSKEEKELIREFGAEYEDYKKRVPMLIPKISQNFETESRAAER